MYRGCRLNKGSTCLSLKVIRHLQPAQHFPSLTATVFHSERFASKGSAWTDQPGGATD